MCWLLLLFCTRRALKKKSPQDFAVCACRCAYKHVGNSGGGRERVALGARSPSAPWESYTYIYKSVACLYSQHILYSISSSSSYTYIITQNFHFCSIDFFFVAIKKLFKIYKLFLRAINNCSFFFFTNFSLSNKKTK